MSKIEVGCLSAEAKKLDVLENTDKDTNNWNSQIEANLFKLVRDCKKNAWCHNERSLHWKNLNLRLNIVLIFISCFSGTIFAYLSGLGGGAGGNYSHIGMAASVVSYIIAVISGVLTFMQPGDKKADHDLHCALYTELQFKVERQLSMAILDREPGDIFSRWIVEQSRLLTRQAPNLYDNVLDKYEKKHNINVEKGGYTATSGGYMNIPSRRSSTGSNYEPSVSEEKTLVSEEKAVVSEEKPVISE